MKLAIAGLMVFALPTIAFASGVMQLKGTISGRTETTVSILSDKEIFTVKKSSLNDQQLKEIAGLKSGNAISIFVPMSGIANVKPDDKSGDKPNDKPTASK